MKMYALDTVFTEEDEKGFYFTDMPENERQQQLHKRRKKFGIPLTVFLVVSIVCTYFIILIDNTPMLDKNTRECQFLDLFIMFIPVVSYFLTALFLNIYVVEVRKMKKSPQYFTIEVLRKLPIESAYSLDAGDGGHTVYYYPVLGKDTTTHYESVCYISYESYKNANIGDAVKILTCIYKKGRRRV